MPFTPVHVLAITPIFFRFRKLPLAALAIGAMIPDFPMFIPVYNYAASHSPIGILVYCLPAGLMVYWLFETFCKPFIVDNCPDFISRRLYPYRNPPTWNMSLMIRGSASIFLGAITHVVWDAFTHKGAWGVEWISILQQRFELFDYFIPYYKGLQHGSTLLGGFLLLILCVRALRNMKTFTLADNHGYNGIIRIAIFITFIAAPCLVLTYYLINNARDLDSVIGYTVKHSIGICLLLLFLYSLTYRISKKSSSPMEV